MYRRDLFYKRTAILLAGILLVGYIGYRHFSSTRSLNGYYTIGVILNNLELTPSDMEVTQLVIKRKVDLINHQGGINGKELRIAYLDDKGTPEGARKVVRETIADKHLIGYVGCWSSTRSKAISEIIGPARMPFIGGYALTTLFEQYPTMYTAERGIKDIAARFDLFIRQKYKRLAFVGKAGDLYSLAMLERMEELVKKDPSVKMVLKKWYPSKGPANKAAYDSLTSILKQEKPDFLLLTFESGTTSALLRQIRLAGIQVPVYTALGDLGLVVSQLKPGLAGELYDLNVVGIPGTLNLRMQEQIPTFMRQVIPGETLELQVNFGARMADSIGILAEAARTKDAQREANIREQINEGLKKFKDGGRIYRGWFEDWFFNDDQAIAGNVLLAWKPPGLPRHILAPEQYMRLNDTLREVPVFFTHMSMVEINRVSDTEGSFYATFYMEITSTSKTAMQQIDFTNAARSETSHEYLLDIKQIRMNIQEGTPTLYNFMYKVSGKFMFEPDLKTYPFDTQKFSIRFQPVSATQPFLVQPSITALNDSVFEVQGWNYQNQFVGYDHDIISYVNTFTDQQHTLPYYKFTYTYLLSRARADFFLKVLVPLLVILIVTYFSVYIPMLGFETLEGIQVTALLASIALYFSAYKPEMEYATISDKIFIFTYIMITSLIGTSILQFVKRDKHDLISRIAKVYQHFIFPVIILVFTLIMVS